MKKLLAFSFLSFAAAVACADTAWFQYSIFSPGDILLPWNRPDVCGLRLDMPYGNNKGSVYGVDLGLVGIASGNMDGLAISAANVVDLGSTSGLQLGGIVNRTKDLYGVQLGGVLNWNADVVYGLQIAPINLNSEFCGLQFGGVNWFANSACGASFGAFFLSESAFTGLSAAAFNYDMKAFNGVQLGGINLAVEHSTGLQVGLVNISKLHDGVQIGLINLNGLGFLPCFPGINFNFSR